jgi:lipopolysaccharide transport system ATP-binding protein
MSSSPSPDATTENVISVHGLSKTYHLYDRPEDRLKQFLYPRLQRLLRRTTHAYYREFWALRDVSFNVCKGETVGIIGRNGSGKSTLLQLIAGTLFPTFGEVRANGRVAALLELGAGFNPEFSGRENIYLNAAILGMTREEIDKHIEGIIDFADIGDFIDQPVKTYSSGMYVRVAFSTAINVNPDVLIVDEALSVGDTAFQQKCLYRIREMQENGVSILLVTHSNNIMLEYCDRGIFLKNGLVLFDGIAKEAVRAYGLDILRDEGGKAPLLAFHPPTHEAYQTTDNQTEEDGKENSTGLPMEVLKVEFKKTDGRVISVFEQDEKFYIDIAFRVRTHIPLPCFGIQISIPDGISLWSTTTKLMGLELPPLEIGKYQLRWQLRANLSGNRYVVALGVGHIEGGEYKRIHALPYAGHFDVLPVPNQGFGWLVVDPVFKIHPFGE